MSSKFDLASQALLLCRANALASFDDGSNEADILTVMYEDFKEDMITRYPWSFCTKTRLLNQDPIAPLAGWKYAHIVPTDMQRLWALYDTNAIGAKGLNEYDIIGSTTGRRILSNYPVLYADYTYKIDEEFFPGYFKQFYIHALGAHIAVPVTDDTDLAANLKQQAWGFPQENEKGGKFAVACGIDAQQKPPESIHDSPLIAARFG